jgi:hypothetical protein
MGRLRIGQNIDAGLRFQIADASRPAHDADPADPLVVPPK